MVYTFSTKKTVDLKLGMCVHVKFLRERGGVQIVSDCDVRKTAMYRVHNYHRSHYTTGWYNLQ